MNIKALEKTLKLIASTTSFLTAIAAHAANFNATWNSVDGGGGICSGGTSSQGTPKFSMIGTVGQPDAATSLNGSYVQEGGFLSAYQQTLGPRLAVTRVGNTFTFTWPNVCAGFMLEGASSLNGPWSSIGSGSVVGQNRQMSVFLPTPPSFFRLRKDCPK